MTPRSMFALALVTAATPAAFADPARVAAEPPDPDRGGVFEIAAALRVRTEALHNLDLDRGLTPSGAPLFAVPPSGGQLLTHADMRLRTDLALHARSAQLAVRARIDVLDNVTLGGSPDGPAATTLSQTAPERAFRLRHAYGEARTAIGVIAAGRIGSHWGMGLFTNGGECMDCNFGDSADRLSFITSVAGHVWQVAYDLSAIGPEGTRADGRGLDLDRADDARTVRISMVRHLGREAIERRLRANVTSVEYGAYYAYRTQDRDSIAVPGGSIVQLPRGLAAHVADGWFRLTAPTLRLEAEAVTIHARIDQASSIPGVWLPRPVTSRQLGAAVRSELGARTAPWGAGVDAGYASGDPAPGFGAFPRTSRPPGPGELEGVQADGITDVRADNFRFHPDFAIDRILFRQIIGTVTDAAYVRPHARFRTRALGAGVLTAELAAIASRAIYAGSTPGGSALLGIELDPSVRFEADDGFTIALDYAVLVPLGGLDDPARPGSARPAQAVRLHLGYAL